MCRPSLFRMFELFCFIHTLPLLHKRFPMPFNSISPQFSKLVNTQKLNICSPCGPPARLFLYFCVFQPLKFCLIILKCNTNILFWPQCYNHSILSVLLLRDRGPETLIFLIPSVLSLKLDNYLFDKVFINIQMSN